MSYYLVVLLSREIILLVVMVVALTLWFESTRYCATGNRTGTSTSTSTCTYARYGPILVQVQYKFPNAYLRNFGLVLYY